VFYRGRDAHVHDLFWGLGGVSHRDLTFGSGAPAPVGDPTALITPSGQHNVFYRATDGLLHRLFWTDNSQLPIDDQNFLKAENKGPQPASNAAAYFNDQDRTTHVIYRTADSHLHELAWTTGPSVQHTELNTLAWLEPALGTPSAYALARDGTQHVVYVTWGGDVRDVIRTRPAA
jgi:hypothetical protein